MFSRLMVLIFILAGCSSNKPTPYQKEKKKQGYRDTVFEELKVSRFKGNSYTKKDRALLYAEFRAIDNCRNDNQKHANIIDVADKTVEKEITRSSGGAWGPSFYGYGHPYYSRYSSIGVGIDYSTINTNSWKETVTFPQIEVYYNCSEKIFRPQIHLKELSAEEMKHLVKDVKGGMQVEKILETSPNKNVLEPGDIILKANGQRVEKVFELIRLFTADERDVSLLILRDGERQTARLRSVDVTDEILKAESEIIHKACHDKKLKKSNGKSELPKHPLCLSVKET